MAQEIIFLRVSPFALIKAIATSSRLPSTLYIILCNLPQGLGTCSVCHK